MLIRQDVVEQIAAGRITAQYRRWKRPAAKAGGRLTAHGVVLAVLSVEAVDPSTLTDADVADAGYADVTAMLADVRPEGTLHRITFALAGDDPRIALRAADELTAADRADLDARLARLDRNGAWTLDTLRLIEAHPARRAGDLAGMLGREPLQDFKNDVRKLKGLGLTESLTVGYRLSPRAVAYLDGLPTLPNA